MSRACEFIRETLEEQCDVDSNSALDEVLDDVEAIEHSAGASRAALPCLSSGAP
jgi:hypothetical protein